MNKHKVIVSIELLAIGHFTVLAITTKIEACIFYWMIMIGLLFFSDREWRRISGKGMWE